MAADRVRKSRALRPEATARLFVIGVVLGAPLAFVLAARLVPGRQTIVLHARVAEAGGWAPADLAARVGAPLRLRLTSDDVTHGFAVGHSASPPIDVPPGETVETTLVFDRPGRYTYYCTRWCGPGHWRMRGVIDVTGQPGDGERAPVQSEPPLYVQLGLDLDAPHAVENGPAQRPSAARGEVLGLAVPAELLSAEMFRASAPADTWQVLRAEAGSAGLDDEQVWDLVAYVWQRSTTPDAVAAGQALYAANCAACHGEAGDGQGVMAAALASGEPDDAGHFGAHTLAPTDFTEPALLLGASPALLQGKIMRGGMGTGMPAWGPILADDQTWALAYYLYGFVFRP